MSLSAVWIGVVVVVVVSSIVICWVKCCIMDTIPMTIQNNKVLDTIPMTIQNNKVKVVSNGSKVWV